MFLVMFVVCVFVSVFCLFALQCVLIVVGWGVCCFGCVAVLLLRVLGWFVCCVCLFVDLLIV